MRSAHSADARNHFVKRGFEYLGRLAFNVPFDRSPAWGREGGMVVISVNAEGKEK